MLNIFPVCESWLKMESNCAQGGKKHAKEKKYIYI